LLLRWEPVQVVAFIHNRHSQRSYCRLKNPVNNSASLADGFKIWRFVLREDTMNICSL